MCDVHSNTHGNSGVCDGDSGVWQCMTVIVECGSV